MYEYIILKSNLICIYMKYLFSLDVNKTMAYSMSLNLIKAKPVDWLG